MLPIVLLAALNNFVHTSFELMFLSSGDRYLTVRFIGHMAFQF